MRVAIDSVGRLVVPKVLREELGLTKPAEVEMTAVDGRLELTVADVPARVAERDGFHVILTEEPMRPLTVGETRDAIDRVRR
jgi:bifunctional DNA-binding transcriptional regulator/antitoxin component of YhaV-PrlF toxin-antitoxin module